MALAQTVRPAAFGIGRGPARRPAVDAGAKASPVRRRTQPMPRKSYDLLRGRVLASGQKPCQTQGGRFAAASRNHASPFFQTPSGEIR